MAVGVRDWLKGNASIKEEKEEHQQTIPSRDQTLFKHNARENYRVGQELVITLFGF